MLLKNVTKYKFIGYGAILNEEFRNFLHIGDILKVVLCLKRKIVQRIIIQISDRES